MRFLLTWVSIMTSLALDSVVSTANNHKLLVNSFQARKFVADQGIFGLAANCHYQTIIGSGVVTQKLFGPIHRTFKTYTETFLTPDGDFFDVDYTENVDDPSRALVVLCHGLESNIHGPLMTRMAYAFLSKGFACALVSFRGCNGEDNLLPGQSLSCMKSKC